MSDKLNIKATEKDLIKQGVLIGAEFLADKEIQVIPVSPAVDMAIGGIPEGSWVTFSGKEKSGKTTLALHLIAKAQAQGRPTFFADVEHRIKPMNLKGIKNLKLAKEPGDTEGLQIIRSNREKILAAEEILTGCANLLKAHPRSVLVIDSTSALCSAKEMNSDITGAGRAIGPRMLAEFCREMGPVVPVNDCVIISIQHLIANTSGYGAAFMEDSGRKIQYQNDVKLRCKKVTPWEENGKQVGQMVDWRVMWSAMGPPGGEPTSWLRYGVGIDEVAEILDIGLDFGLITAAGAWMTATCLVESDDPAVDEFVGKNDREKSLKCQGRAKMYQLLADNPPLQKIIYDKILEMVQ